MRLQENMTNLAELNTPILDSDNLSNTSDSGSETTSRKQKKKKKFSKSEGQNGSGEVNPLTAKINQRSKRGF